MSNGALVFRSAPDYETKKSYMVTVTATDGEMTATPRHVTVTVINVNEMGAVDLSTTRPQIGTAITASLTDEDGVVRIVRWEWARSESMGGSYSNISGAATDTYTPVEADAEMYLRATAFYTDGHGSGKSESAETANMVPAAGVDAGDPVLANLLDKFDTNPQNGQIDKSEVVDAIIAFVTPGASDKPSKEDIVDLIVHFVTTPR